MRRQEILLESALLAEEIESLTAAVGDPQQSNSKLDQISALTVPDANRILFWRNSSGEIEWLTLGTGLSITGTTINATGGGGSVPQSPNLRVQAADYTIPANYGMVVPDSYEIGDGFTLEIAAGGILAII